MGKTSDLIKNRFKKKNLTINDIITDLKAHKGHGTESNPEQYGEMFFNILMLSEVPVNDLIRYSEYAIGTLKRKIQKEVENNG